jgi:hypothetical protein
MKSADPFAGVKLSEAAKPASGPIDQQLFGSRPATAPSQAAAPAPIADSFPSRPEQAPKRPEPKPSADERSIFDINDQPWHKDSFMLTESEFERIHDLKLRLRREFDLNATKNDIARAALHFICEDFERNPDKSVILTALRKKRG